MEKVDPTGKAQVILEAVIRDLLHVYPYIDLTKLL